MVRDIDQGWKTELITAGILAIIEYFEFSFFKVRMGMEDVR